MRVHRISIARLLLLGLLVASFPSIAGAAAYPTADTGFGSDGTVRFDSISGHWSTIAAVQSDGRIIVSAESVTGPGLLRLNQDGTVDSSFGTDGWFAVPAMVAGDGFPFLADLVIRPDGAILTAWDTSLAELSSFAVVQVDSSGSVDADFGEDGLVLIDEFTPGWVLDRLGGIAIQPDGNIVGVGIQFQLVGDEFNPIGIEDGVVFRLLPDGSFDPSFGSGGLAIFDTSDSDGFVDVVVAPSGEIIVGGYVGEAWDRQLESEPTSMAVVRFTEDGRLDKSFGDEGLVALDILDRDGAGEVAVHGQSKIVAIGGGGDEFGPQRTAVARWNWDGSPDVTFGSGGAVITGFGDVELPYEQITDAVIQPDHKIVVAGFREEERAVDDDTSTLVRTAFLKRLNQDGSPDTLFGHQGRFDFDEDGPEVFSVTLDRLDRIVTAGRNVDALQVTRFLNNVAFDGRRFVDDDLNQFEGDIAWIADQGITIGCNPPRNTRYCPSRAVTRGEVAALLTRALGLADSGGGDFFSDDDGSVFEGDIDRLAAAGITRGCNPPANSRFCPDTSVTRGQMAALLTRALGLADSGGGDFFSDDDGSVFEGDIDRLAAAGITRGCNPPANSHYCPTRSVTRGQVAAFLYRAFG